MSVRRAQDERLEGTPDGNTAITGIMDVPDAPTIGAVSDPGTDGYASVAFTAATTGGTATSYTATSSPGNISGSSATSPITVTGLTIGQAYTFTVTGTNSTGTGAASNASASFTPAAHTSYESIATATGTGSNTSITFSSIPSTYKHLQIRGISRNTGGSVSYSIYLSFNGTSSGYSWHWVKGDGDTASTSGIASEVNIELKHAEAGGTSTASVVGAQIIDILDYASTSKYKTVRAITGTNANTSSANFAVSLGSGLWQSTNAITSVTIANGYDFFSTSTTFALYGIKG